MWAVKKERKYEKDENGSLQHGVFPDGHPSNYKPCLIGLNFCNRTRAGEVSMVIENGKPNFYFTFIWVSCVGLASLRNKSIYFFLKTKLNKSLAPFLCVTVPHDLHWFSSEHRSYALSDGVRIWMGDCMGIGFLFCICRFILSVRSYRFLQPKLGTIKLMLRLVYLQK